jgi:hypothetical protein
MGAGLKIHIQRSGSGACSGELQGKNFGVLHAFIGMKAFAYNFALIIHNHRSHARVGRSQTYTAARKFERPAKISFVLLVIGHEY